MTVDKRRPSPAKIGDIEQAWRTEVNAVAVGLRVGVDAATRATPAPQERQVRQGAPEQGEREDV